MSVDFNLLKPFEDVRKDLEKKQKDIEKMLKEFEQQQKTSVANFQKILDESLKATKKQIELDTSQTIIINSDGKKLYKTTITALSSITENYPLEKPGKEDAYWERYKELVDNALATRKEIILKVIETIGTAIGGILNPTKAVTSGETSSNSNNSDD